VVRYKSFLYQAASWKTVRRVVAKVEFHCGELFPSRRLHRDQSGDFKPGGVRFYNKRGAAEQISMTTPRTQREVPESG
jgi:hypothetical protein